MTGCIAVLVLVAGIASGGPQGDSGGWNFVRPYVVPEPAEMTCVSNVCVRLDGAARVRLVTGETRNADWLSDHLAAALHVRPSVEVSTGEGLPTGDAYRLSADASGFTVRAADLAGVRNAFQTLRQILVAERGVAAAKAWISPAFEIADRPAHDFRAVHVCWFPETEARHVERLIRAAAACKFNCVILESWGTFRFETNPWYGWPEGSMTKDVVRRLADLARDLGVTLVPQINVFGHAAASRGGAGKHAGIDLHPERASLFEPRAGWTWCLTNPEVFRVQCELLAEMHEAFGNPPYFHIGCDEADQPTCPRCRATDWPVTVGEHIRKVREFLAKRGARALMWHDMLVSKDEPAFADLPRYPVNGASKEVCGKLLARIPEDVVVCDWYYGPERETFPTWKRFAETGHAVVPCSWDDVFGTVSMGRAAEKAKVFGFMATTWHTPCGTALYRILLPAAYAAWGQTDAYMRYPLYGHTCDKHDFATIWRQAGWDMGMASEDEAGWDHDSVPVRTVTGK